jgi:hypothetical protein
MSGWQHRLEHWSVEDLAELDVRLKVWGDAGWELVSVVPGPGIPFERTLPYEVGVYASLLLFLKRPQAG